MSDHSKTAGPKKTHHGGLDLSACRGHYRVEVDVALKAIASARLPDGRRPFLTDALDIVRTSNTVRTSVLYDRLPQGNPTRPNPFGDLTDVQITITSISFMGAMAEYGDGSIRTLETVLAHELGHAARLIRRLASQVWEVEEKIVTGLENEYRYARNITPQRKLYDGAPVKQYP
jgi:hypothetical protein